MPSASQRIRLGLLPDRRTLPGATALLALAVLAIGAGSIGQSHYTQTLPVDPARHSLAVERIDPNTAGQASLRRLPNIGPTRAQAILQYRQTHGPAPFADAADLMAVPGIGLGTARMIAPYLPLPSSLP